MSHFTHLKTRFQNLFYLAKALIKLNISHEIRQNILVSETNFGKKNILISQPNRHDLTFIYNGQEYELVADLSFWKQPHHFTNFIDKITQQYAKEVIIGEGQKMGFQLVKYTQNSDGSNTLVLERWRNKYI
jgi:hypothetical protein